MLLKMARLQIIGLRDDLDIAVAALQRVGVVQIEDASRDLAVDSVALDDEHARLHEDLTYLAARLDALLRLLAAAPDTSPPTANLPASSRALADEVTATLDRVAPPLQALAQRRDDLNAEAASLPRYAATLRRLVPLSLEIHTLHGYDTAVLLIDRGRRAVLDFIDVEVQRVAGEQSELIQQDLDDHTTAAILVYPKAAASDVQALFSRENITPAHLPAEMDGRTFRGALAAVNQRQAVVHAELQRIDAELAQGGIEWGGRLAQWRREVGNRLQALAAQGRFGATGYAFVVEGWAPQRDVARVRQALAETLGERVVVMEVEVTPKEREHAPVAFANPRPLRPFQSVVTLMATPASGEIDPTPFVALFFPLFFGIIVGDVAYGLMILALALWLERKMRHQPLMRDIARLWLYGAVWAILFGFLYGEFLGPLGHQLGMRPLWMARDAERIVSLFLFALVLGAAQVTLGIVLGAWQAWRERQRHELVARLGTLLALTALFGVAASLAGLLPHALFTPFLVAVLVGVVVLSVPHGPIGVILGPLEMLETTGNVLSYLRLAAIGLAGVYLALVANTMAGAVGNIVLGVIIAVMLHALNLAMNIMSPTIQSLRLQYVEFFRHFYKGGGQEYKPFRLG